jgi:hypothetical protein
MSNQLLALCALSLLFEPVSLAQAQNSPSIRLSNLNVALDGHAGEDKYCLEWTDGCVKCVREREGARSACSNIGIACQPKESRCVRRVELSSYIVCDLRLIDQPCK